MKLDNDKKFGEIHPSAEALQTALTELETEYKETVSDTQIPLRFLTLRDSPPSEPEGNTIHLRLTRREDYNQDWDYVAVSYTWAQPEDLEAQFNTPEFKIWINDTDSRPPYCPPSVLHRALQYDAQEAKTGRFWIDQECIDQDDAKDRDEHIAHMHKIYERSKCTTIILSHAISLSRATLLQRCIEAAGSDRLGSIVRKEDQEEGHIDPEVHALFHDVAEDPYFTRAWTYQEQRCSKTSCFLISILPDHSTFLKKTCRQDRRMIFMPNTFAHSLYRWCKSHLFHGDVIGRLNDGSLDHLPMLLTLDLLLVLSKTFRFSEHELVDRRTLTVVTDRASEDIHAIWGMKARDCKYVSDRVTIVANVCGFQNTLRTTELQDNHEASYSTCVLALLLMNKLYDGSISEIMDKTLDDIIDVD
jgi:hypothetical protein